LTGYDWERSLIFWMPTGIGTIGRPLTLLIHWSV